MADQTYGPSSPDDEEEYFQASDGKLMKRRKGDTKRASKPAPAAEGKGSGKKGGDDSETYSLLEALKGRALGVRDLDLLMRNPVGMALLAMNATKSAKGGLKTVLDQGQGALAGLSPMEIVGGVGREMAETALPGSTSKTDLEREFSSPNAAQLQRDRLAMGDGDNAARKRYWRELGKSYAGDVADLGIAAAGSAAPLALAPKLRLPAGASRAAALETTADPITAMYTKMGDRAAAAEAARLAEIGSSPTAGVPGVGLKPRITAPRNPKSALKGASPDELVKDYLDIPPTESEVLRQQIDTRAAGLERYAKETGIDLDDLRELIAKRLDDTMEARQPPGPEMQRRLRLALGEDPTAINLGTKDIIGEGTGLGDDLGIPRDFTAPYPVQKTPVGSSRYHIDPANLAGSDEIPMNVGIPELQPERLQGSLPSGVQPLDLSSVPVPPASPTGKPIGKVKLHMADNARPLSAEGRRALERQGVQVRDVPKTPESLPVPDKGPIITEYNGPVGASQYGEVDLPDPSKSGDLLLTEDISDALNRLAAARNAHRALVEEASARLNIPKDDLLQLGPTKLRQMLEELDK